ncbi:AAA family ATPase [Pseudolactococcus yaeyamensis]
MRTITLFNNKGGVGKTTTLAHLAAYFSLEMKKKVLVMDLDPQANITQLTFGEDELDDIFQSGSNNIVNIIDPLNDEVSTKISNISNNIRRSKDKEKKIHNFGYDIIPSHPTLSRFEETLSNAWTDMRAIKKGGIIRTNWLLQLLREAEELNYDYVFIDVGPSLGALNRSILLNTEFLVTPMGADIFSVLGAENISEWVSLFRKQYNRAIDGFNLDYENFIKNELLTQTSDSSTIFLGYLIQQSLLYKGRATRAYQAVTDPIPDAIFDNLEFLNLKNIPKEDLFLGEIKNLKSLIPESQSNHIPMFKLNASNTKSIQGANLALPVEAKKIFETICTKIISNIEVNSNEL